MHASKGAGRIVIRQVGGSEGIRPSRSGLELTGQLRSGRAVSVLDTATAPRSALADCLCGHRSSGAGVADALSTGKVEVGGGACTTRGDARRSGWSALFGVFDMWVRVGSSVLYIWRSADCVHTPGKPRDLSRSLDGTLLSLSLHQRSRAQRAS